MRNSSLVNPRRTRLGIGEPTLVALLSHTISLVGYPAVLQEHPPSSRRDVTTKNGLFILLMLPTTAVLPCNISFLIVGLLPLISFFPICCKIIPSQSVPILEMTMQYLNHSFTFSVCVQSRKKNPLGSQVHIKHCCTCVDQRTSKG